MAASPFTWKDGVFRRVASSFTWRVRLTDTWKTSPRFFHKIMRGTSLWFQAVRQPNNLIDLEICKDTSDEAEAIIKMQVQRKFYTKTVNNWVKCGNVAYIEIDKSMRNDYGDLRQLDIICTDIKILSRSSDELASTQFDCWKQFHLNPTFSDFLVIINNEKLPVHKLVLAARSSVFFKIFTTDMREATQNQIELKHDEADVIKEMIEYFYSGNTNAKTDVKVALKMVNVAHKYDVKHLISICEWTFMSNLTTENVLEILDRVETYDLVPWLREKALRFLVLEKHKVIPRSDFGDFASKHPDLICEFLRLDVSERLP